MIRKYARIKCMMGLLLAGLSFTGTAQESAINQSNVPPCVRTKAGEVYEIGDHMTVKHIARHQRYNSLDTASYDVDINSPKSVNISPNGSKYYVNSLEGYRTVAYDVKTHKKVACVKHAFTDKDSLLWAKESGLYEFTYEPSHKNTFSGKPVESTFSHGGRYLWVPYYRRSFDINAQDPSAIAVIDTEKDSIVRMFESGVLPKMVVASPDGRWLAVSHWGENTVGLIDVSSDTVANWHYSNNFVIDYRLKLKFSRTTTVNRDVNSGYCLRGTVFTPDSRYLLVGCMGGGGGVAVIDLQNQMYIGQVFGMMSNLRHLVIQDGWLYLSINSGGYVQRIRLDIFLSAITNMKDKKAKVSDWETCKVAGGARTISISPDGRYVFAACNSGNCLAVVETKEFKMVGSVPVDSYPVGLDISSDGSMVMVTSQGRDEKGGNSVNVYQIEYKDNAGEEKCDKQK